MSTVVQTANVNLPQSLSEEEIFNVLSNSLYPGAQRESIMLVRNYCRAAGLDPMLKPVHIVPMFCATGKKDSKGYDIKAMRDVIMPGIGMYRIQASRSGEYAGASEPEFGADVTEDLDGVSVTFPKWCKITIKRKLINGVIAEFTAIEYWKENYATKSKSSAPNAMWAKRPYGQIAKCAEAQALRKAFPEVGSAPTADEMEGKEIDVTPQEEVKAIKQPTSKSAPKEEEKHSEVIDGETGEVVKSNQSFSDSAEEGEIAFITTKLNALKNVSKEDVMSEAGVSSLEGLTKDGFNALREAIKGKS